MGGVDPGNLGSQLEWGPVLIALGSLSAVFLMRINKKWSDYKHSIFAGQIPFMPFLAFVKLRKPFWETFAHLLGMDLSGGRE